MFRIAFPFHRGFAVLVLLGGLVATLRGQDTPPTREQQIAEIQKQLADLEKRLADLKKGTPVAAGGKKPITLAEADTWRSIRGASLSPDGKWFAHRVGPNEGESDLILRNNSDGKETKFPGGGGFGQMQFSHDSKWFGFSYTPYTKAGTTPPARDRNRRSCS